MRGSRMYMHAWFVLRATTMIQLYLSMLQDACFDWIANDCINKKEIITMTISIHVFERMTLYSHART